MPAGSWRIGGYVVEIGQFRTAEGFCSFWAPRETVFGSGWLRTASDISLPGWFSCPFFPLSVGNFITILSCSFACASATRAHQVCQPKGCHQDTSGFRSGALRGASLLSKKALIPSESWRGGAWPPFKSVERIIRIYCNRHPWWYKPHACFSRLFLDQCRRSRAGWETAQSQSWRSSLLSTRQDVRSKCVKTVPDFTWHWNLNYLAFLVVCVRFVANPM